MIIAIAGINFDLFKTAAFRKIHPSLQKSLGRQSQGGRGAAVEGYRKPFPTRDLAP
jgi:hypothetical protein